MKLRLLLSGAAALALLPASVFADPVTVGTVNVTGHVNASCSVRTGLTGLIDLGELDDATTGLLSSSLTGTGQFGTPSSVSGRVTCVGAAPIFHLRAIQLYNGDTSPPTGYTNRVNYRATLTLTEVGSATESATYTTSDAYLAATDKTLGARLTATGNNVTVSVDQLSVVGTNPILETGVYNAATLNGVPAITVTVDPGV